MTAVQPIASRHFSAKLRNLGLGAGVFILTLLAYWPAVHAEFIWNDSDYVTAPALQSLHGLWRIWTEVGATEQYYPLLHSAFWLEHRLWGDAPAGYHLVNILLHAGAACLFAAVLQRLCPPAAIAGGAGLRPASRQSKTGATIGEHARGVFSIPWLAAFIFALHPVCVESVAWISEQKNTLSLVFYLAAALLWLRFAESESEGEGESPAGTIRAARARRDYRWATIFFVGALLSKTTTATLPAALLVIVWWRCGRIEWRRDVRPLLPWFVLGAVMGLFSAWVEKHYIGAEGSEFGLNLLQRALLAGRIVWFYLGKLIAPANLIFIYPRWNIDPAAAWQWTFPLALIAVTIGLWVLRRRRRGPLAVLLLFVGSLFPVLGFFNVFAFMFSFVADHWQYLPCLAVIALVAVPLVRAPRWAAVLVVGALAILTWRQSGMYANMDTFYRTTLARNPNCWMAENNLGSLLKQAGRTDEALAHYEAALRLKPDSSKAHTNIGIILRDQKRPADALPHFEAAVKLEPDASVYQDNLAAALRDVGRPRDAVPHHREALRLDPGYHAAHNNYGVTLRELGRNDEALREFETAARLDPTSAPAHLNLMFSYWQAGRIEEARREYEIARRLNPAIPELDLTAPPK